LPIGLLSLRDWLEVVSWVEPVRGVALKVPLLEVSPAAMRLGTTRLVVDAAPCWGGWASRGLHKEDMSVTGSIVVK